MLAASVTVVSSNGEDADGKNVFSGLEEAAEMVSTVIAELE